MSRDPEAPTPFADDPQGDPVLRELFGAARRDRPSIDAASLSARAMTPRASNAWVVGGVAVLVLAVILAALRVEGPVAESAPTEEAPARPPVSPALMSPPSVSPPPAPPPVSSPLVSSPPVSPVPVSPVPELPEAEAAPRSARRSAAEAPVVSEALEEGAILLRARRALAAGDDVAALAAVAEHEAHFARGPLAPEREAIAIDALSRAGRAGDAAARAERFLSRWPESAYADRARRARSPE